MARVQRAPDRLAADLTATRQWAGEARREPPSARLRERDRRELSHRSRSRRGEDANVVDRTSPELRSAAPVGRPSLVGGDGVNLFGDLAVDLELADRLVHTWWPDVAGTVSDVRFAHSPGRLDPAYLGSLRAFDVAFLLDLGDGTQGIVGVDVKYHEWLKPEIPKPSNLWRYLEVAERSGAFGRGAVDEVKGKSGLCEMWLEHLLLLSMLQHASGMWTFGRYVVVYLAGNTDLAEACSRYRALLVEQTTFSSVKVEVLLKTNALPAKTAAALRDRYLPS